MSAPDKLLSKVRLDCKHTEDISILWELLTTLAVFITTLVVLSVYVINPDKWAGLGIAVFSMCFLLGTKMSADHVFTFIVVL